MVVFPTDSPYSCRNLHSQLLVDQKSSCPIISPTAMFPLGSLEFLPSNLLVLMLHSNRSLSDGTTPSLHMSHASCRYLGISDVACDKMSVKFVGMNSLAIVSLCVKLGSSEKLFQKAKSSSGYSDKSLSKIFSLSGVYMHLYFSSGCFPGCPA